MFDYLFEFNVIGIAIVVLLGLLLLLLFLISLFIKKEKLTKIVRIAKIIFILLAIAIVSIITICVIFDCFTKKNICDKVKQYISTKYNIPIKDIEIFNYKSGSAVSFCLDECRPMPYRILIKFNESSYCVNAYDLSERYIYPTNLYWNDEIKDTDHCDEIDYDIYYDLATDKKA